MYAVIRAGGKQFRVTPGDVIRVEKAAADKHGHVQFGDVLAVSAEAGKIARPNGSGATVTGQVMEEGRARKILVFKFKRKKQYKRMQGHRQDYTEVRIIEIGYEGKKYAAPDLPAKKARPAKSETSEAAGEGKTHAASGKTKHATSGHATQAHATSTSETRHAAGKATAKKAAGKKPAKGSKKKK